MNNFADGKKQDAYDVLSGKISAEQIREMVVENEKKVSVAASKGSDDETFTPVEKKGMISRETGVGYWQIYITYYVTYIFLGFRHLLLIDSNPSSKQHLISQHLLLQR